MDDLEIPSSEELEEEQERVAAERAKKREREISDFRRLMNESWGRRFVWRLMQEAKLFQDCSSSDPLDMARFLGERRQGLKLMREILEICPDHWVNMLKDQKL